MDYFFFAKLTTTKDFIERISGEDYVVDIEADVKYKDAQTVIKDGCGYLHYGYFCNCWMCPYIVYDVDGHGSCYGEMYKEDCSAN